MDRTIGYAFNFLLHTLDCSPDEPSVPSNEADLRLQPTADPMQKDQYSVIIWNGDKHSFDEVIQLICDATNRDRKEAAAMAHTIDEHGFHWSRDNRHVPRLLEIAQVISKIEIGVTIQRAYDTFREQVVAVIIERPLNLTRSTLGTDTLIIRKVLASELLSPRPLQRRPHQVFLYHTRLWKKPRISLKEVYASILTLSHPHKVAIGLVSHDETFLTTKITLRESFRRRVPAHRGCLSPCRQGGGNVDQILRPPAFYRSIHSNSYHIEQCHDLVARLLDVIINFFMNQIVNKRILPAPSNASEVAKLDVDSFPFKSKCFMPVLSDLRYLCHNEPIQQLIAKNPSFIRKFSKVLHTDAWISVFNVTLSLSRVIKVYGEAFGWATPSQFMNAISIVVTDILSVCTLENDKLDKNKFSKLAYRDGSLWRRRIRDRGV
ncbi:hypothetical protein JVT61DRAFT_9073 [Boletus reticuloceps]|uniref:E3 ubiquitin-protein ligase n=1 Tax=Boletus reticuloceps TaxID=495285 RepID=A0A8I2YGS0_9AGAM|nr:hypothetical protein JVT61DRAFT_9036 [Boletus reticuloceps]KAG6371726.1 hypothetical protein JVT61DRAFT_9073 [Boletus reticuloceps]